MTCLTLHDAEKRHKMTQDFWLLRGFRVAQIIQVKSGWWRNSWIWNLEGEKQSDVMIDPTLCELMNLHEGNRVIFKIIGRRNKNGRSKIKFWGSHNIGSRNSKHFQTSLSKLFSMAGIGCKKLVVITCSYPKNHSFHLNREFHCCSWLLVISVLLLNDSPRWFCTSAQRSGSRFAMIWGWVTELFWWNLRRMMTEPNRSPCRTITILESEKVGYCYFYKRDLHSITLAYCWHFSFDLHTKSIQFTNHDSSRVFNHQIQSLQIIWFSSWFGLTTNSQRWNENS
jgi:hypothetical protein